MPDPAPSKAPCSSSCPATLESVELVAEGCCRCTRYNRLIVALLVVNLLIALTSLVTGLARNPASPADPDPRPSSTAPADPSPSSPPTSEPPSTPKPTPTMPPDPTGTACNIFDPECSSGTGGAEA